MPKNRTRHLIALGAALYTVPGCDEAGPADQVDPTQTNQAVAAAAGKDSPYDAVAAAALAGVLSPENPLVGSGDWPSAGHDWAHTGWNTRENKIKAGNACHLTPIWNYAFAPPGGSPIPTISTVVTSGQTAYAADAGGFLHAINLTTGARQWTKWASQASVDPVFGATVLGGPVVTSDAVYVGDADSSVTRVSRTAAASPEPDFFNPARDIVWRTTVDSDPASLILGDLATYMELSTRKSYVVFGVSSFENVTSTGELTHRGSVAALDTSNGARKWQVFTTSDQNSASPKFGAGAGVWSSPAIDPLFGIYIGTGQFYELGASVPGAVSANDIDLSDSILRIGSFGGNAGKLIGNKQFTANDYFGNKFPNGKDWDVGTPPNLLPPIPRSNQLPILPIGVGSKEGVYRVLDRQNFREIWSVQVAAGSRIGGFQATAAYANGVIYVAAHEGHIPNGPRGVSLDALVPPGQSATYLNTPEGVLLQQKGAATNILALNYATGKPIWNRRIIGPVTYAPLIVANGLVYHGAADGSIRALDASTGATRGKAQLGGVPIDPTNPQAGLVYGNVITALSIAQGRLLVSSQPVVPYPDGSNLGVVAYGVTETSLCGEPVEGAEELLQP